MIIVDTNVVSELMKPSPATAVRDWIAAHTDDELYTTSITLAEVRSGIERLPDGHRRALLREIAHDVFNAFEQQVLPFDARAATHYAAIVTKRDSVGLPISGFDAQIAAICRTHDATLATRNLADFQETGVGVVDPWQDPDR